ncbi:MAG: HD domain-containing protein [Acidobacteria bacterium]|nr:HD domain-containing protein [Acidobacteriota bacterium]
MDTKRFEQQINFLLEIDKLKSVLRRTYLIAEDRHENTAEHSWHLAMMAMLLAEYANEPIVTARVIMMVLVQDIVEIDAGDTYFYDAAGALDKAERERRAADRLFAVLPEDQGRELRELWEELESGQTPESRFASALDRFIPQLHNYYTQGKSWKEHGVTAERVLERNASMAGGSTKLWEWTRALLDDAVEKGFLSRR